MSLLIDPAPHSVMLNGQAWDIRTDFRIALQFESLMLDRSLAAREKVILAINLFFPKLPPSPLEALDSIACVLPGVTGRLTVIQNGESWYIDGAPKRTPEFSDGSVVQDFQFVLHCPYPYWRSTADGSAQVAGLTKLFQFPCSLAGTWHISKYSDSLFTVVNNDGTAVMEFDVIFTAATEVTDPEFYHVERGTFIKINKVMAAGEKITVSTVYGRKGVTLQLPDGTQANGFKYLDVGSDLNMQMAPGANTIRCDAANNREGLRVQVIMPKGVVPGI